MNRSSAPRFKMLSCIWPNTTRLLEDTRNH